MQLRAKSSSVFTLISKTMAVTLLLKGTFLLMLIPCSVLGQNQQPAHSKFLPDLFSTIQARLGGYKPFSYIHRPIGPFPATGYRPGEVSFYSYSYPFVQPVPQQPVIHFTGPTKTLQNGVLPTPPAVRDEVRKQPPSNPSLNSDTGIPKVKHSHSPPSLSLLPPSTDNRNLHDVRFIQPPSALPSETTRKEVPLEKFHKPVFVDPTFGSSNSRKSVISSASVPSNSDNVFVRHKNPQISFGSEPFVVNTKHFNISNLPVQPPRISPHINKGRRPFDNFKPIPSRTKSFPTGKPILTETTTPEVSRKQISVDINHEELPGSTQETNPPLVPSASTSYSAEVKPPEKHPKTNTPTILKEQKVTQATQGEPLSPPASKENTQESIHKPEINPKPSPASVTSVIPNEDEAPKTMTELPSPPKEYFVNDNTPPPPPETKSAVPSSEVDILDETSPITNLGLQDNKVLTGTPEEILTLKLADAINNFGFGLYRKMTEARNVFLSPLSLSAALAIVLEGASNMTAVQMMNSLHFSESNIRPEEVKAGFKRLMKALKSRRSDYQFENANLLLLQEKFAFKSQYSNTVYRHYKPLLGSVDFGADGLNIKRNVNDWVKRKTHGKIDNFLVEQLPPETVFAVLNAVYFRGQWTQPFDRKLTKPSLFYNYGKDPFEVTMMKQIGSFPAGYSAKLNSQIVELPYEGEETSMVILLPEEHEGIYQLRNKLSYQELYVILSAIDVHSVKLSLPRFSLRSRYDLEDVLKEIGMKDVFIPGKANFGRMTNVTGLFLSKVSHEGVIEVDEKGTEAAAITGGFIVPLNRPREIIVDHPFFFFIRNRNNGAILFIGQFDAFDS